MSGIRGTSAVVGVGLSTRWEAPGRTALELLAEAVHAALADAGLRLDQVDGLLTGTAVHFMPTLSVAEYLGIRPRFLDGTMIGGSSFVEHLIPASLALNAGLCDVALICYGSNQRTASGRLVSGSEPQPYEAPYGPRNPITGYALAAARHMHQYGTMRRHLAEVALAARSWARLNPEAFAREPTTIEEILAARMVNDPLSVRDCCLVTDGAGAVVMVRSDRATDFPKPPAYLLGAAAATWHRQISAMPDLTVTAASESGPRAFAMAEVVPSDIDVLQLYDAFTINTILFLEDLGFCPKGEGGRFVEGGTIAPGGRLAVNTNGGGLSCCHPGMYGLFPLIESVRQLRGEAGERQVVETELALVHGNGGQLSSQVTAILGTAATL
ncbi:MAG: thiolase [Alphaproteobacteria bacterium]|nr:thiolase [Alphaproteobacteria bacterium]